MGLRNTVFDIWRLAWPLIVLAILIVIGLSFFEVFTGKPFPS